MTLLSSSEQMLLRRTNARRPPTAANRLIAAMTCQGESGREVERSAARPPRVLMWIVIKFQVAFHSSTDMLD